MTLLFKPEPLPVPNIDGLHYIPDYISVDEEEALLKAIDQQSWMTDLKRRVQH